MTKIDTVRTAIHTITDVIVRAKDTVQGGTMVDLSGLDARVAKVCDDTLKLPPVEAVELQPLMAEMIGHLEDLSAALHDYQSAHRTKN